MMTAIKAEILSYLEAVRGTDAELYPVYEFVAAHGDEAKDALWSLWRDKAVRLVAISDYRDATQEQLDASLEGVNETLFYARAV
jgi:hypothetical protein